jgi:tripartite-type tricarboxylate transporter receptor subunit TctC
LLLGTVANTINAAIAPTSKSSFTKDFDPVIALVTLPNIVVHPETGINNLGELITVAKKTPDKLLFASSGVGTSPHLSGELFNQMAGVKITHVPYPGSGQAVTIFWRIAFSSCFHRPQPSSLTSRKES